MKHIFFVIHFVLCFCLGLFSQNNTNISNLALLDWEPYIVVNPSNPNNVVAAWMRLKIDNRVWIATRASFDGGNTWGTINFLPHYSPTFQSADVSIAFSNNGIAYLSYVDYKLAHDSGLVYVTKSTNGGITWNTPVKVIDMTDSPDIPIDRPWIEVDKSGTSSDGTIYLTSMSAFFYSGKHHVWLRKSTDGGSTWSTPVQVDNAAYGTIAGIPYGSVSVGKDAKLYILLVSYNPSVYLFSRLGCAVSTDGGNTFQFYQVEHYFATPDTCYQNGYVIAADPSNNNTAVSCWLDYRSQNDTADILLSRTVDGGQTWSSPVRVNDDPLGNMVGQDMPWISFTKNGTLCVVWRDRRNGNSSSTSSFDVYGTLSYDGGVTFIPNSRLSTISSPFKYVNRGNDFMSVAISDSAFYACWSDYRNNDWDVYVNKLNFTTAINNIDSEVAATIFPNPGKSSFTVEINLREKKHIIIEIADELGKRIKKVVDAEMLPGQQSVILDTGDIPSGNYFVLISDEKNILCKKIIVIK